MKDQPQKVLHPDGTTAAITYSNDSALHDSSTWTFTVWVKFADPTLNPYDQDEWEAGHFDRHYTSGLDGLRFKHNDISPSVRARALAGVWIDGKRIRATYRPLKQWLADYRKEPV